MNAVKKIGIAFVSLMLFLLISNGVLLVAFSQVITNRDQVKIIATNRATYTAFTETLTQEKAGSNNQKLPNDTQSTIENVAITKLVKKYLTPQNYNRIVVSIVDSTYDWLEGKSEQPEFNINLAPDRSEFQRFIVQVYTERYMALPDCTTSTDLSLYNPLEATCKIEGYSAESVQTYINDLADTPELNELYGNASVNSELIFGELSAGSTDKFRGWYNTLKLIPIIFGFLLIILIGLIFLITSNWRNGIKYSAKAIMIPSLFTLASTLIFSYFAKPVILENLVINSNQDSLREVLSFAISQITNLAIIYSAILSILSAVILVVVYFVRRKEPEANRENPISSVHKDNNDSTAQTL